MLRTIIPQFHHYIPEELKEGFLYISMEFGTAVHKCCCGCKREVVTPLGTGWWTLTVKNDLVSLTPSISSYQLPCKSHYLIKNNEIEWLIE